MKKLIFPILIFILVSWVYYLTSAGKTPYDYFTRLADSFLQGKYYLTENPTWLNELIPQEENKFYVAYPPMPALLSIPFRLILKDNFQQQYLAHMLGAGFVILIYFLAKTLSSNKKLAIYITILAAFGNLIWFLASVGSSWYIGQVSGVFFLTLSLYLSFKKKNLFLIGLFLGAACLSRIELALTFPFLIILNTKNKKEFIKNTLKIALGTLPFFLFDAFYNFIRFGVIWNKGYLLIPNLFSEPWFQKGIINISYIPRHIKAMFFSFPIFQNTPPFILPSLNSLSIWITSPFFLYCLFADIKDRVVKISWLCIFSLAFFLFLHGTWGFAQFGYRFAADFYPFLFILLIKALDKKKLLWHHYLLGIISVLINLWGVLFINKLNLFSF